MSTEYQEREDRRLYELERDRDEAEQEQRPLTLPEIVSRYRELLHELELAGGEVTDEVAAELDALAPTLEDKVAAYAAVYRQLGRDAVACAEMSDHYGKRCVSLEKQRDGLQARLEASLRQLNLTRVKTPTATVWLQRASKPRLVVKDEQAAISAGYWRDKRTLDTERLRADLERGEPCAFAELETTESLRIK